MRFVWAIVAFVLATVMIGGGIAQRTIFQAPETETLTMDTAASAPYVLVDGSVFASHPGAQTLRVEGDPGVFAAYARTTDLTAWLSASDFTRVTVDSQGTPEVEDVAAVAPADGEEREALSPVGSDLWLDEFQQEGDLATTLQLPDDTSVLLATDGTAAAPSSFTVSWPTGATTPWAGPLLVGGGVMLFIGAVLYVLALRHVRRSRGPRRKGLPMPVTEPITLAIEGSDKGVISSTPPRRRRSVGRRSLLVAPALLVSAGLLAGCAPDAWPDLGASPSPSPTESVLVPEGQGAPAVTETQAERILDRISKTVASADEKADATAAATRLAGPALAERKVNYRLQDEIDDQEPLAPIPAGKLTAFLPQAQDGWPRMFLAVVEESDGAATVMTVTQADAWSDYKLSYLSSLRADASMNLAAPYVGAVAVEPNSPFLVMAPEEVAPAYADLLNKGDKSEFASMFDEETDPFRAQVADKRAELLKNFNKTGEKTGKVSFRATPGSTDPLSLVTLDSGAIVAVTVVENETVVPTNDDAVIKLGNNVVVKALSGVSQSSTGFQTRYSDQLYFFVPAQGSNDPIQLIASRSNILDAKVVEKE